MLRIDLTSADHRLIAEANEDGEWEGSVSDALSGKRAKFKMTNSEIGAVVAIVLAGDDSFDDVVNKKLYEVAELALKDFPEELRPIP